MRKFDVGSGFNIKDCMEIEVRFRSGLSGGVGVGHACMHVRTSTYLHDMSANVVYRMHSHSLTHVHTHAHARTHTGDIFVE